MEPPTRPHTPLLVTAAPSLPVPQGYCALNPLMTWQVLVIADCELCQLQSAPGTQSSWRAPAPAAPSSPGGEGSSSKLAKSYPSQRQEVSLKLRLPAVHLSLIDESPEVGEPWQRARLLVAGRE